MPRGKKPANKAGKDGPKDLSTLPAAFAAHMFKPGQSGNPGGIPISYQQVKKFCKENTMKAARQLVKLIDCPDYRVSYAASVYVMERAVGKVKESDDDKGRPRPDLTQLDDKEMRQFRKLAAKMITLPAAREPETIEGEATEVAPPARTS